MDHIWFIVINFLFILDFKFLKLKIIKDIKITAEERATIAEQLPHPFDDQFNKNESKQTQSSQQQSSQSSQKPKIQEVDPNQTNRMYQSEEEIYGR